MISRNHHNLFSLSMLFGLLFAVPVLLCGAVLAEDEGHDADDHEHAAGDHTHDEDHDDEHDAGAHHAEDASHDSHGAPPLKEDSAFWSILAFAGFCFAINKLGIWNWLHVSMAEREKNEGDVIATAENHLAEARVSLGKYRGQLEAMDETVAETLAEAKRDADHTQGEIVEAANREAELMVHRTEHEIERSRDQSLNSLFGHLAQRVAEAAEVKVKANLQANDQDRLIDETLSQLTTS